MNPTLIALVFAAVSAPDGSTGLKSSVASCGDINGDGIPDLAVAGRELQAPDLVMIVSGKDGSLLRILEEKRKYTGLPTRVVGIGDFDGDQSPDLAVEYREAGSRIYSGKTGLELLELEDVGDIAPVRDLDGDGRPDLLYAARGRGAVLRYGAKDKPALEIRPELTEPMRFANFADALCWAPDVDGDGLPDIAVSCVGIELGTGSQQHQRGFEVAVYSSKDGKRLWEFFDKEDGDGYASILRPLADIDGDGMADLIVSLEDRYVITLSGKTGAQIYQSKAARHVIYAFGSSLDVVGDVDKDGITDWVLGANEQWPADFFDFGSACLYSGKTGKTLLELEHSNDFGFDVCAAGDVDVDGVPDVAIFVERESVHVPAPNTVSALSLRSGKDGHLIWRRTVPELRLGSQAKPDK